jgi:hypothetical protein
VACPARRPRTDALIDTVAASPLAPVEQWSAEYTARQINDPYPLPGDGRLPAPRR